MTMRTSITAATKKRLFRLKRRLSNISERSIDVGKSIHVPSAPSTKPGDDAGETSPRDLAIQAALKAAKEAKEANASVDEPAPLGEPPSSLVPPPVSFASIHESRQEPPIAPRSVELAEHSPPPVASIPESRREPSPVAPRSVEIAEHSPNDLAAEAAEEKKRSVRDSLPLSLLITDEQDCVAPFRRDEIVLGPLLGSGEFSHVYEAQSFRLDEVVGASTSKEERKRRNYMKKCEKYHQTTNARYALKHIKEEYLEASLEENDSEAYVQAARDLSLEAEILASLNHPNIIKLRGMTQSGTAGFSQGPCGYFLIVDRLFETLDQRIKRWREQPENGRPDQRPLKGDGLELTDEALDERLSIALQISAAVMYLHYHSIIFRDLKPANIGFDVRGDVKIFDFGLACIMPANGRHYNETFEMSGAGSPRYMAPECLCDEPYNMKADVYSFSILFWEVLAAETPYAFARTMHELVYHVVEEDGRPDIPEGWPANVRQILEAGFDEDMHFRPKMSFVHHGIRGALTSLRGGNAEGLSDSFIQRRRSCESFALNSQMSFGSSVGALSALNNVSSNSNNSIFSRSVLSIKE